MADNDGSGSATSVCKRKTPSSTNDAATHVPSSEVEASLHDNKRKRIHKRKRKRTNHNDASSSTTNNITTISTTTATTTMIAIPNTDNIKRLFNGLIVAISTLESSSSSKPEAEEKLPINKLEYHHNINTNEDSSGNDNNSIYHNYKSLQQTLQCYGATISPQVHKRVHYLLCSYSAMIHATQRVRQAHKRNVDIVDVAWVKECIDGGKIVDVDKYLCNDKVECWLAEREKEKRREARNKVENSNSGVGGNDEKDHDFNNNEEENGGGGWSTPIQLDCCCVCHENGDDACPWCVDCNLTLARKQKAVTN